MLERELAQPFDDGFPHLARIPAAQVVPFLDSVDDLDAKHRALLRGELLAQAGCVAARVQPPAPAIERMRTARRGAGEVVGG